MTDEFAARLEQAFLTGGVMLLSPEEVSALYFALVATTPE